MEERKTSGRYWRIGELAEATGLTVRTLHHYEHIGLLAPAERTEGHQRLYNERDVRRLYRIRALRDLGLPLADIGQMLDDEGAALGDMLRTHLARVDAELERLGRLRALLDRACTQSARLTDPDDVLEAIDAMSRISRRVNARTTQGRAPGDAESRWRELANELRACMEAGEAPSGPRARAAARSAQERLRAFAGDERETLDALACLRRLDPPENLAGWDPELMRYLDQALATLHETEDEPC
jgi:DNA-binding transcriptional MerR regulator